jgi:hypothetical protein
LAEWTTTVSAQLPHLSKPQAVGLALWSFGMVMARSCGLTTVAVLLAALLNQKDNTVRQRLREWYKDAKDKKGRHPTAQGNQRQALDVTTCFAPLLRWVLRWWPAEEKRLALALDATTLGQRFVVLAISVVYRGCAIPVAWVVIPATQPGAWQPHWVRLCGYLKGSIPADWVVIVLADRGLYAPWLFRTIQHLDWHPFLRVNAGGKYRLKTGSEWRLLGQVVPQVGVAWCGEVVCFKRHQLACTLLACWEEGHQEAWLILTDLAPAQAQVAWYSLRAWIEAGFKHTKRGGWQWQNTRITDPARATRFWLAIAVATLWVVSVGGEADATLPASSLADLPATHVARRTTRRSQPRLVSCFRRGLLVILATLLQGHPLPLGRFYPEPWPSTTRPPALSSP